MTNTQKKLTPPQKALLDRFPESFLVFEGFSTSNSPRTVIQDLSGRYLFSLARGEAAAFKSLVRIEQVVRIELLSSADAGRDHFAIRVKAVR